VSSCSLPKKASCKGHRSHHDANIRLSLPSSSLPRRDHQSLRLVIFSLLFELPRYRRNVSPCAGLPSAMKHSENGALSSDRLTLTACDHKSPQHGNRWHLDEVFLKINGRLHYLWRAVDQDGRSLIEQMTKAGLSCLSR
jgi:hypothetical protein